MKHHLIIQKKLNHGEAVILGMKTALNFSLKNNLLKKSDHKSILDHINNHNLPSSLKKYFKFQDINKILNFMLNDKKNNSKKINLVLLKKIGTPLINQQFTKKQIAEFLKVELNN